MNLQFTFPDLLLQLGYVLSLSVKKPPKTGNTPLSNIHLVFNGSREQYNRNSATTLTLHKVTSRIKRQLCNTAEKSARQTVTCFFVFVFGFFGFFVCLFLQLVLPFLPSPPFKVSPPEMIIDKTHKPCMLWRIQLGCGAYE